MKKIKMIAASIMTVAALATSVTGINASAYELEAYNDEIVIDEMSNSWTTVNFDVGEEGKKCKTFSVSTARYIYINFSTASPEPALVSICRASDNVEVTSVVIPISGSSSVTTSRYLPNSGTYYFFVSPYTGSSTTGSFAYSF